MSEAINGIDPSERSELDLFPGGFTNERAQRVNEVKPTT